MCISPEQTTWAAPLGWHVPPGQGTLGQDQSSGSSPSHLNSSAQTWPSDSLNGTCPRTDTALPHPSSAQITWAVRSVKFPSDTRVQASPECTSTHLEQGHPLKPDAQNLTETKNNKHSECSWTWLDNWKQHSQAWDGVKAFLSNSGIRGDKKREFDCHCQTAFSWASFWRDIQKDWRISSEWLNPENIYRLGLLIPIWGMETTVPKETAQW